MRRKRASREQELDGENDRETGAREGKTTREGQADEEEITEEEEKFKVEKERGELNTEGRNDALHGARLRRDPSLNLLNSAITDFLSTFFQKNISFIS